MEFKAAATAPVELVPRAAIAPEQSERAVYPLDRNILLRAAGLSRSRHANETYSWNQLDKVPGITLESGRTCRLELQLGDVLSRPSGGAIKLNPGDYDLEMSTTFQRLVGDRDGACADFSPIHLTVKTAQHGRVSSDR